MVVIIYYCVGCKYRATTWYLKKNQHESRPSEHPLVRGVRHNKYPFLAVEITPFWRMHEIISERAVTPGSTTARLFATSLKSQSCCDKLSGRSASRLRKEILGTRDKKVAAAYTMLESLLEFIRDKRGASVTD